MTSSSRHSHASTRHAICAAMFAWVVTTPQSQAEAGAERRDPTGVNGVGHDGTCAGVRERVLPLRLRRRLTDRHDDTAGAPRPPLRDDVRRAGSDEEGDAGLDHVASSAVAAAAAARVGGPVVVEEEE